MRARISGLFLSALVMAAFLPSGPAGARSADAAEVVTGTVKAGYGEADATWRVGAGAGQYSRKSPDNVVNSVSGNDVDPHGNSITQKDSYGVQSRLSYRAIVVDDGKGDQVAFVKSDNYLAQDYLQRRVGQILAERGSQIDYDEIFHMASHNHSSPYYMTPSWGVWVFQDAFDIRAFEYHARAMADAILAAEQSLVPARMGATTVEHNLFKGMIQRKGISDDGTPRGYPDDFGDLGLSVLRFDDMTNPDTPRPLATLINWGQHPEGLDDHDLITGDFVASLERFVERETGAPLVFGQGDVGSAEAGPGRPDLVAPLGIKPRWSHVGHGQTERGAFLLSQDVVRAHALIDTPDPLVPFSSDFDVEAGSAWVAGPYSHPYPSVSNCRTETTVEGRPGAPVAGFPDCERSPAGPSPDQLLWEKLKEAGVPVPDNYDAPSFTGVQENTRLHLQAFKVGDVIIASCACEAQVDLILNFESRANDVERDIWDGFDWREVMDCTQQSAGGDWKCVKDPNYPRQGAILSNFTATDYEYRRMVAQIHNDAAGWDSLENVPNAMSEPYDTTKIFGNFTKEELTEDTGYKLAIGVGHAGDYNGYTVSYREYQSWDDYRKALTPYGPHTADYMVTRMVRLAEYLNTGEMHPELALDIQRGLPDEARQVAMATALGQVSQRYYDAWRTAVPTDAGEPAVVQEPENIKRFDSATFSWRGGSNAVDNPVARVERKVDGEWVPFADHSGEVQTRVEFPNGANAFVDTYSGGQEWIWTANFEAFNAFPTGIGSTPAGEYRFVVEGKHRAMQTSPPSDKSYRLESAPFSVSPWDGVGVRGLQVNGDGVSFSVDPIAYPKTYTNEAFPYIQSSGDLTAQGDAVMKDGICTTCTFRAWAAAGQLDRAAVTIVSADGRQREVPADCTPNGTVKPNEPIGYSCAAPATVGADGSVVIMRGDVVDNYGETTPTCVGVDGPVECPTAPDPDPTEAVAVATTLSVDDPGTGQYTDEVTFTVRLQTQDGRPIAGEAVELELTGPDSTRSLSARTGEGGVATVTTELLEAPGQYYLWARYAGQDNAFEPSASAPQDFVIEREDTSLSLEAVGKGSKRSLDAQLLEDEGGVGDRVVDFFAGDQLIGSDRTDGTGRATIEIPPRYRGGNQTYTARFGGDGYFRSSSSGAV